MLILASTTDKLQVVCGNAGTVNVHASYLDNVSGAVNPGRKNTTIINTAVTDVVNPPGANVQRTLKTLHVHNHGAQSTLVGVLITDGTTTCTLHSVLLPPNGTLQYIDELGFVISDLFNRIVIQNIATNYTVSVQDNNGIINCNGSFTLSLPAAAVVGSGFQFRIRNNGALTVTIDPAGTETINGLASIKCCAKEQFTVVCDGASWFTIGRSSVVRLDYQQITNAQRVDLLFPPDYNIFDVIFHSVTFKPPGTVVMQLDNSSGDLWGGSYQNQLTYSWGNQLVPYPTLNYAYATISVVTQLSTGGDSDMSGNLRIFPDMVGFRGPTWFGQARYTWDDSHTQVSGTYVGEIIGALHNRATKVLIGNVGSTMSGLFFLSGHIPGNA
jgi:hypothetical protein